VSVLTLSWAAGTNVSFRRIVWSGIERRVGLLPSVIARDTGPPRGPAALAANVRLPASPSAIASSDLDWSLPVAADGTLLEGEAIAYQVGRRHLSSDATTPAPSPAPPDGGDLPRPLAPIYVSIEAASSASPDRVLYRDDGEGAGLDAGWWGWWVRGVDLFGRVSPPSSWAIAKIVDVAPAPAPVMVQAEWVQRDLPAMTVAVIGRSIEASRWLATSDADEGLVAAWTLPPEQTEARDDIDGFRLLLRTAQPRPAAAPGAALVYPPWPEPIATYGPLEIKAEGTISTAPVSDPALAVTLSAAEPMPPSPHPPKTVTVVRTAFRTDLELDGATGVFVGGTVTIGADSWPVVANGDGPNIVIVVEHPEGGAPAIGPARLQAPAGRLIEIRTTAPALAGAIGVVPRSGLLESGGRFLVLRSSGNTFLCVRPPGLAAVNLPLAGSRATWHPVWFAALDDAGFGPVASAVNPVVNAQVAVQAVRLTETRALVSTPSAPLTVTAVDVARPETPTITPIAFDPAATCAQLASRADWYGNSQFTFEWDAIPSCTFTVHRALAEEVFRLDREHLRSGGTRDLDQEMWPQGVWNDAARKNRVEGDLAALEAVADADAWEAGYRKLRIDAQMLLARQAHTWSAFTPLFGRPIAETNYTDTLNGRTRAHWLYAVTARSRSGVESAPSEISPPICCPDVVPPAPPLTHSALAAEGAVKLKWLASPDADTHHYEVFAARVAEAVQDLDALSPVPTHALDEQASAATPTYAPQPHVSGRTIERLVPRARNQMGDWCFWIVAVDTSGNRSTPSRMLRGRALTPPPLPPVWVTAERTNAGVELTWTYPTGTDGYTEDPRWACLVERYSEADDRWQAISPWLPRGVYVYTDTPSDQDAAWYYRLRVRDHEMRLAPVIPETFLESTP
jgi:hypothetical protein